VKAFVRGKISALATPWPAIQQLLICRFFDCVSNVHLRVVLWACVVRLYKDGKTDEALKALKALVDQCGDDSAVRVGDVLSLLLTHYARCAQWKQVSAAVQCRG